jgi:hypothetical protein
MASLAPQASHDQIAHQPRGPPIPLRPLSRLKTALFIGVLCVGNATPGANGAERPATTNDQSGGRLLTFAEGQTLADIALEHSRANSRPDCSHLVHEILTDAGLSYPYATSSEIFAGIPQFQRMRDPQPGDLIVWPGHVGIVVSPEQTTFFSFTGSGPGTHQYSNDYWRHRGHPRFYRYVVAGRTQLTARRAISEDDVKQSRDIEKTSSSERPQVEEHSPDAAIHAEPLPSDPSYAVEDHEFPESIQIVGEHRSPMKKDIEETIAELMDTSVSVLENNNPTSMSIVFLRSFKVERVKLAAHKGWVQLRVQSHVELNPDGSWKRSRIQNLRCELRRDQARWVLFTPRDRLYVPENVAIPVLAKKIAELSKLPATPVQRQHLKVLAAVLNELLNGS